MSPFLWKYEIDSVKLNSNGVSASNIKLLNSSFLKIKLEKYEQHIIVYFRVKYILKDNKGYYSSEEWTFFRKTGLLSQKAEVMKNLLCPKCSVGSNFTDAGVCNNCNTHIKHGNMQWGLISHKVLERY